MDSDNTPRVTSSDDTSSSGTSQDGIGFIPMACKMVTIVIDQALNEFILEECEVVLAPLKESWLL